MFPNTYSFFRTIYFLLRQLFYEYVHGQKRIRVIAQSQLRRLRKYQSVVILFFGHKMTLLSFIIYLNHLNSVANKFHEKKIGVFLYLKMFTRKCWGPPPLYKRGLLNMDVEAGCIGTLPSPMLSQLCPFNYQSGFTMAEVLHRLAKSEIHYQSPHSFSDEITLVSEN